MTLTGSGMLLTLRHYIGFLSYAVDVLRYVALNVVNLRCLVVIHWSFQHVHDSPYSSFGRNKIEPIMLYEGIMPKISGSIAPSPSR